MYASRTCAIMGTESIPTGGWCLGQRDKESTQQFPMLVLKDARAYRIPRGHVAVSERIALTLVELIRSENVTSVSDYGAGVGQLYCVRAINRNESVWVRSNSPSAG